MTGPRARQQQAALNTKRKASEDIRPTACNKRMRETIATTAASRKGEMIEKKTSKRKRDDNADPEPRKKARTEHRNPKKKIQRTYREPKGARKSKRIAGEPAEGSNFPLKGQYVQHVVDTDALHQVDHATSSSDPSKAQSQQSDVPAPTPVAQQNDTGPSVHDGAAESPDCQQEFLMIIANNVGSHRIVRYLTSNYNQWVQRATDLVHVRYGLNDIDDQLKRMEHDGEYTWEDLELLRSRRERRLEQIDEARAHVDKQTKTMNDLNAKHAIRNERIYDFMDVPKDSPELVCLTQEFWTAYNRCYLAQSACKDIELEIHQVETEQRDYFQQLDEQTGDSIIRNEGDASTSRSGTVPMYASRELLRDFTKHVQALSNISTNLGQLKARLDLAKDAQYDQESEMNKIAEIALTAAGKLFTLPGVEEVKLHRRFAEMHEPGVQREAQESSLLGPERRNASSAPEHVEKVKTKAELRKARERVETCERRLDEIREGPFSDASSLDSDQKGEARVRKMIERTQEVRDAQDQYSEILHRAQDNGALSEQDLESNFPDHESDGYRDSDLGRFLQHPKTKAQMGRIQKWAESIGHIKKPRQIGKGTEAENKEGSWVDRVLSFDFGEDLEVKDTSRFGALIEEQKQLCEHLRATGPFETAENDFHPKNNPVPPGSAQVLQSNHESRLQLDEDEDEIQ